LAEDTLNNDEPIVVLAPVKVLKAPDIVVFEVTVSAEANLAPVIDEPIILFPPIVLLATNNP
jgi:hypothetical protein